LVDVTRDGRWIAFRSDRVGNQDLWKQRIDGSEPVRLTSDHALEWDPNWSPDGTTLSFYSNRSGTRTERRITDFTGRRRTIGFQPPSTDGTYVHFARRNDLGDIWVMDVR
jgi:Tol biopolymer transport system component